MDAPNLISVCLIAFAAVFVLLAFLAATMHGITTFFPARQPRIDATLVAAITTAVTTVYPGAHVTKIEEER